MGLMAQYQSGTPVFKSQESQGRRKQEWNRKII